MLMKRMTAAFISSLAWTALTLQFCINIERAITSDASVVADVVSYLSFFTVLTNLSIGACLALVAYEPDAESFWNWPIVQTALAVYILVVAIVYATVLQNLWTPHGLEYLTDRIFHAIVPVLYIVYWVFFTPKGSLRFADQIFWLSYPFVYLLYTLARGALVGAYPYPFLDVALDGYEGVFLNSLKLLVLFFMLGSLLILADKMLATLQTRWQGQLPG